MGLKRHIELEHEGKKPFSCPICAATFTQKPSMKNHILSIHEGRKFECDICDSHFAQKRGLNKHKARVHDISAICVREENIDFANWQNEGENESIIPQIKDENIDFVNVQNECIIKEELFNESETNPI